jgi:hypothetical protein
MENGSHSSNGKRDVAQIARANGLVDATPESIRELADSAMLLSQGAHRAIEMGVDTMDCDPGGGRSYLDAR